MTTNQFILNEFRPGELWPDHLGVHINAHGGGVLFHQGIYYWFGEHKIEGTAGNNAEVGVHAYSSSNLYQWKDEGIALKVSDNPESEIVRGCILERPKVIYNRQTRKFVMWFHLELKGSGYSSARSGVAVADQPTGPYQFIHSVRPDVGFWPANMPENLKKPLSTGEQAQLEGLEFPGHPVLHYPPQLIFRRDFTKGQMARDMNLFADDDGAAYQIYSSEENGTLHISRLSHDYLQSSGHYIRLFPGRFHEAPALMKRRGKYFLISSACTGWDANAARLSVADSIWGPWKELGNPCRGDEKQIVTTFESQSTFILPVADKDDAYIFMADRWRPANAIDGRYIWLPVQFENDLPFLEWKDRWDLNFFA
jgi:beta-xylosidase